MADICDPVADLGHGAEALEHRFWVRFAEVGHGIKTVATTLSGSVHEVGNGLTATVDAISTRVEGAGNGLSATRDALAAALYLARAVGHGGVITRSRAHEAASATGQGAETLTHCLAMTAVATGTGLAALRQVGTAADRTAPRGHGAETLTHRRSITLAAVGQGSEAVAQSFSAQTRATATGNGLAAWTATLRAASAVLSGGTGLSGWRDALGAHQSAVVVGFGLGWATDGAIGGQTWTANTETWAASEWRDLPLTEIAWDGAALLGVAADGLYRLDAATDNYGDGGIDIAAWIETGLTDFGSPALKRATDAYLGVSCVGALTLQVGSTALGTETTQSYLARRTEGAAVQAKANLGKGILSRYWRFKVSNSNGEEFALHDLRVQVDDTGRRGP